MKLFCFPAWNDTLSGYVTFCCCYSTVNGCPPKIQRNLFPRYWYLRDFFIPSHNGKYFQCTHGFLTAQFPQFLSFQKQIIIKALDLVIEFLCLPKPVRMPTAKTQLSGGYAVACGGWHFYIPSVFIYITYPILFIYRLMLY